MNIPKWHARNMWFDPESLNYCNPQNGDWRFKPCSTTTISFMTFMGCLKSKDWMFVVVQPGNLPAWYYWNVGYELAPAGLVPTVIWVWVELNVSLTHWFSKWRVIYCIEASIQRLGYPLYRPIDVTNYQVITRLRVCGIRTCGPFWRKRYVQEAIHIYCTFTHLHIFI